MIKEKYDILVVKNEDDYFFCLYENATEQAIDFFFFKDDAEEKMNFLNRGGAFDGFTPSFVLKEVALQKTQKEINTNFEQLLR